MTAKPATERMAALRKRRQEAGFARLELWLHPDDHEAVKEAAAKLQRKRDKAAHDRQLSVSPAEMVCSGCPLMEVLLGVTF